MGKKRRGGWMGVGVGWDMGLFLKERKKSNENND